VRGTTPFVVNPSVRQATVFASCTDINARTQAQAINLNNVILALNEPSRPNSTPICLARISRKSDSTIRRAPKSTDYNLGYHTR
jgi:hypothetical protein